MRKYKKIQENTCENVKNQLYSDYSASWGRLSLMNRNKLSSTFSHYTNMRQSDKENPIIPRLKQMKRRLFLVSNTWHFFLFVLLLQMIAVTFREILRCIEERDAAPMIECLFDESRGTRWRGGTERKMKTEGQDGENRLAFSPSDHKLSATFWFWHFSLRRLIYLLRFLLDCQLSTISWSEIRWGDCSFVGFMGSPSITCVL